LRNHSSYLVMRLVMMIVLQELLESVTNIAKLNNDLQEVSMYY